MKRKLQVASRRRRADTLRKSMATFKQTGPAIWIAISSICHADVGRGRQRRSSRANCGPNFSTQPNTPSGTAGLRILAEELRGKLQTIAILPARVQKGLAFSRKQRIRVDVRGRLKRCDEP